MNKKQILESLKKVRETSKKRNFSQSIDIVINLKDLDLKKPDHKINNFATVPHGRGKKIKVCALVGGELNNDAKEHCDYTILKENFSSYEKRKLKKVMRDHEFFIAQANIMPDVAKAFGRFLGTAGKMPNPKAGMIVPPKGSTKMIVEKLQKTVRIATKNELAVKCSVGMETMDDDKLVDNAEAVYKEVIHHLPLHDQNVRSVFIKATMGKPVEVGGKEK
ncbi:50S ribosomal protein L1 [archaeon]|jgi:large subunit ribosomal protein L1|nr:50S ribosomal protein L1 [archaeon]MBT4416732.1 50S ribosomal protein L1 [archaeon]